MDIKIEESHKIKNPLLIFSSTFFFTPIIFLILDNPLNLIYKKHEVCISLLTCLFSITRWSMPYYIFRKIDQIIAIIAFTYYSIFGFIKKEDYSMHMKTVLISVIFFFLSKITRRIYKFKYWYIFHFLFHLFGFLNLINYYEAFNILK